MYYCARSMKLHIFIILSAFLRAYSTTKTSPDNITVTSSFDTEPPGTLLQIDTKVVGGFRCKVSYHPYTVSIRFARTRRLHCTGSLLSKFWVLTAAHCCYRMFQTGSFVVVAGVSSMMKRNDSDEIMQSSLVTSCKIHSRYDDLYLYNDIALLELESPIEESASVGYAKLPPKANLNYDQLTAACQMAMVTGWGDQYAKGPNGEPLSTPIPPEDSFLQCIFLPIITREECEGRYQQPVPDSVLCAFEHGKDACQGDSGGPLICDDDFVYGVVSSGFGCAFEGYPGLYTRVDLFLDFINETTATPSAAGRLFKHLNCYIFFLGFIIFIVVTVDMT